MVIVMQPPSTQKSSSPASHWNLVCTTDTPFSPDGSPSLHHIQFDRLAAFEVLVDQYEDMGVQFEGAIAIYPSNSSFPMPTGRPVIISVNNQANVVIRFNQPVQWIRAIATSYAAIWIQDKTGLQTVGAAHNKGTVQTSGNPFQAGIEALPAQTLELSGASMTEVKIRAGSPFVLTDLLFVPAV
jgi:hypothetical protein